MPHEGGGLAGQIRPQTHEFPGFEGDHGLAQPLDAVPKAALPGRADKTVSLIQAAIHIIPETGIAIVQGGAACPRPGSAAVHPKADQPDGGGCAGQAD